MKRKQGFRYPAFFVLGQAAGASAGGEPTPRADTPTPEPSRHPDTLSQPDTPTPRHPKEGAANANRCKGMQGGARGCKGMQAEKQGERGQGQGVKSRGGKGCSQKRKKALALNRTQQH